MDGDILVLSSALALRGVRKVFWSLEREQLLTRCYPGH